MVTDCCTFFNWTDDFNNFLCCRARFFSRRLNSIQIQIENYPIRPSVPFLPLFPSTAFLSPKIVKICAQLLKYCVRALFELLCTMADVAKKKMRAACVSKPFSELAKRVSVKPSIKYSQQADDEHFHKFTAMSHEP